MQELQMILNTLAQIGEAGKEAFIWWLIMDKGLPFLGWIITLLLITKGVIVTIRSFTYEKTVQELRDLMDIGSPGCIVQHEIESMKDWIRKRHSL